MSSQMIAAAEHVLINRLLSNDAPLTGKNKIGLGLTALSVFLLAIAAGFFTYAAHLWLTNNYAPEVAALATGSVALGLSLLSVLIAYAFFRYKRYKVNQIKDEVMDTINLALEVAEDELSLSVRENPKTAVLVASFAGLVAGNKVF